MVVWHVQELLGPRDRSRHTALVGTHPSLPLSWRFREAPCFWMFD